MFSSSFNQSPLNFNDLNRNVNNQPNPNLNSSSNSTNQNINSQDLSTSYLPGYLSSAARGSNLPLSTPPRHSQQQQSQHQSSSHHHPLTKSPLSTSTGSNPNASQSGGAFGAGSLFGSTLSPLSSKSHRNSIFGSNTDDQEAPPTTFLQDEEVTYTPPPGAPSAQEIHKLTPWHHGAQNSVNNEVNESVEIRTITLFGFTPDLKARLIDVYLPKFGLIENVKDGLNWIDIVFAKSSSAQTLLKVNGTKIDELGGIMLGVKLTYSSNNSNLYEFDQSFNNINNYQVNRNSNLFNDNTKTLTPLPPSEAFKPIPKPQSSTNTLRSFWSSNNRNQSNEYGINPSQINDEVTHNNSSQSWTGKLADLIFGF